MASTVLSWLDGYRPLATVQSPAVSSLAVYSSSQAVEAPVASVYAYRSVKKGAVAST